jgi:antitoxin (DNA-binding transcriptional repressor) of toxin-antitoxin stability system
LAFQLERLFRLSYFGFMKKASITEAKNNLSALIDGLRSGSPVLIVDRGRPVAQLEAVGGEGQDAENGRLSRLVRDGIVRPGRAALARTLFMSPPPRAHGGVSALALLNEERREGR